MGQEKLNSVISTIAEVRKETASVIVFCSFGKDSMVMLDLLYPKFDKIVCVFMYFVKDLEHVNKYLRFCQVKYPKCEWIQMPHWNLSRIRRVGMYCIPNPDQKLISFKDTIEEVRSITGIHWVFLGMKKADSLNRRLMLMQYPNHMNNGLAYPLSEMTNKEVESYMRIAKLPTPVRYSKKASGGVGFNIECFLWLKEHYPQDLEKIYTEFPLSRRILFEYDKKQ